MDEKQLTQFKFMALQAANGDILKAKEILEWVLDKTELKATETAKLIPLVGGGA